MLWGVWTRFEDCCCWTFPFKEDPSPRGTTGGLFFSTLVLLVVALPGEPSTTLVHFLSKFDIRESVFTELSNVSFKLTFDWSRFGSPVFNAAKSLNAFFRFFLARNIALTSSDQSLQYTQTPISQLEPTHFWHIG